MLDRICSLRYSEIGLFHKIMGIFYLQAFADRRLGTYTFVRIGFGMSVGQSEGSLTNRAKSVRWKAKCYLYFRGK